MRNRGLNWTRVSLRRDRMIPDGLGSGAGARERKYWARPQPGPRVVIIVMRFMGLEVSPRVTRGRRSSSAALDIMGSAPGLQLRGVAR